MLSQENRLASRNDFDLICRTGKLFSFGHVFLRIRENKLEKTRIGFSIGIKFSKKAVERNRIRRQLREIARTLEEKIEKKVDIVVMVRRKGGEKITYDSLNNDFQKALEKGNLINLK